MKSTIKIECTIKGCNRSTLTPHSDNPRKRWIVGLEMLDSDGCFACEKMDNELTHTCKMVKINLCPSCAKTQLNLTESDYDRISKGEAIATGKLPQTELIQ